MKVSFFGFGLIFTSMIIGCTHAEKQSERAPSSAQTTRSYFGKTDEDNRSKYCEVHLYDFGGGKKGFRNTIKDGTVVSNLDVTIDEKTGTASIGDNLQGTYKVSGNELQISFPQYYKLRIGVRGSDVTYFESIYTEEHPALKRSTSRSICGNLKFDRERNGYYGGTPGDYVEGR